MTSAVRGGSQANHLRAQFDWAVILIFGNVVEGGVYRHASKSMLAHQI